MKVSPVGTEAGNSDESSERYDLFVSYGHHDLNWVESFIDDLKQEYSDLYARDLTVFLDRDDIQASDIWDSAIRRAMERSSALICFLSPRYFSSEYCRKEWEYFYRGSTSKGLIIFPVRIRSWDEVRHFSQSQEEQIREIRKIQTMDFEGVPRGRERSMKLRELARAIYEQLPTSPRENIHARSNEVTPDNIENTLDVIMGAKQQNYRYPEKEPVFVLYTGGTVGMLRSNPDDPTSQLVIGPLKKIIELRELSQLRELPFDIDFYSFKEPLDSSNIGAEDWKEIAKIIKASYKHYQGFVILHGTDTMSYTASALSFMFVHLGKPVILTGAERAPSAMTSDAPRNITNAIRLAAPHDTEGVPVIPEVCIFFGRKLLRGNRTKKIQALSPDEGFDSPNQDLLGEVKDSGGGIDDFDINGTLILPPPRPLEEFDLNEHVSKNVWIVEVFPNMNTDVLHKILSDETLKGIILKTYGTGNAPTMPGNFLGAIYEAVRGNKIVVNLTQCPVGHVEVRLFETNAHLYDIGVINGGDMTSEAAFCKLSCLIGTYEDEFERHVKEIKSEMQRDLRGELRYSAYTLSYIGEGKKDEIGQIDRVFNGEGKPIGNFDNTQIDHAKLHLHGIEMLGVSPRAVKLKVLMNCDHIDEAKPNSYQDKIIGRVETQWRGLSAELNFNLDVTRKVKELYIPSQNNKLHVISECEFPIKLEALELSIFTKRSRLGAG
jgi:L-asparaginase